MAITITKDTDFSGSELINLLPERLDNDPTENLFLGRLYFNKTLSVLRYYNGSVWGNIDSSTGTSPLTANYPLEIIADVININDVTQTASGAMTGGDKLALDSHLSADNPHSTLKLTGGSLTGPLYLSAKPTLAMEAASKEYVDDIVTSSGRPPEPYDPTSTSSYPVLYNGLSIQKGDHFIITVAGNLGPAPVKAVTSNDSVISLKDSPGNLHADWVVITAVTSVHDASYTVKGITQYADNTVIDDLISGTSNIGTSTQTVTPDMLKKYNNATGIVDKKAGDKVVAAGDILRASSFLDFKHDLGTTDVHVEIHLNGEKVYPTIKVVDVDNISFKARVIGTYRIIVMG